MHDHFLPVIAAGLVLTDLGAGLNWMLAPPSALTSPVYATATRVLPMHTYGLLFLILGLSTAAVRSLPGARAIVLGLVGGGFWAFWTVLFTLAPLGRPGTSYLGAITSAFLALSHLAAGAALYYRPPTDGT